MMPTPAKADTLPQVESMDSAAWKRTLKDVPVAIAAGAVGYGVGRTALELFGNHLARTGQTSPVAKAMPQIMAVLSAGAGLAHARQRGILKERREAASREVK
jgi:hypothetical protein